MLVLLQLLLFTLASGEDWFEIEYGSPIQIDFEDFDLQISTTSRLSSVEMISLGLGPRAQLEIALSSPAAYKLASCSDRFFAFPVAVPRDNDRVWRVRFEGDTLVIACNEVQLLEYEFSDQCDDYYTAPVKRVVFNRNDTASNSYRFASRVEGSAYESSCYNSSCYPRWGNLLKGREVIANSTCGTKGFSEEYCLVSNEDEAIMCGECDDRDPSLAHPPEYVKDSRIKDQTTWWKAENGVNEVTLQLDLEATFQFTHLIMVFYSFRPAAMVIERSTDNGKTWQVYQYFAYDCEGVFGMQERELGEEDEHGVRRHPDEDVICTSKYSYLEPAQGGEVIYKVIRGRPTDNTNRASLRNLLLLTNLRVRFVKLHMLGDEMLDPDDPETKKKYFYAVEDWVVRGSCFCNGHAETCSPLNGIGNARDAMIFGECDCQHNTEGVNCERCKDFHHALPWQPGDPSSGAAHPCQRCSCNGHSEECEFDDELYHTTGDGGKCTKCQHGTAGAHCETCVYGYHQISGLSLDSPDICQPCDCNEAGTTSQICAAVTTGTVTAGSCICKANVAPSAKCDRCKDGHYGISAENPLGCTACGCDMRGSVRDDTSCDLVTGQCNCKENVEGQACDRCKEGYFNMRESSRKGCEKCRCDAPGVAEKGKCDALTGACVCKTGFTGHSCEDVLPGYFVPTLDYWSFEPEISDSFSQGVSVEGSADASGTGYVIVPEGGSFSIETDETAEDPDDLLSTLPTGSYDLELLLVPGEEDVRLRVTVAHSGRADGRQPGMVVCGDQVLPPYAVQESTLFIKAGSRVAVMEEGICLEEGSLYKITVTLDNGETISIRDMTFTIPLDPSRAFPGDVEKQRLYEEYQRLQCPLSDSTAPPEISNDCFRIKALLDAENAERPCRLSLCLPSLSLITGSSEIDTEGGASIQSADGGKVVLPERAWMRVDLEPGDTTGMRELVIQSGGSGATVQITVTHKGSGSFRCNGEVHQAGTALTFTLQLSSNLTTIGDLCVEGGGEYELYLEVTEGEVSLERIFLLPPDDGSLAYPHNPRLADLWDQYIDEGCPKIEGDYNHAKPRCVSLFNKIKALEDDDKVDCTESLCIPYKVIWRPGEPIDNLDGGSFIDPETGRVSLADEAGSIVELPVAGRDSVTGHTTDLVIKHEELTEPREVIIQLVRMDVTESHECGLLRSVPQTQIIGAVLSGVASVVSSFCLVPGGRYELRISSSRDAEEVSISEIGSILPSNAYPDNEELSDYLAAYRREDCPLYANGVEPTQTCLHLANLIDYLSDPERQAQKDCSVRLCLPTSEMGEVSEVDGGATVDPIDSSVHLPPNGQVTFLVWALTSGPNELVVERSGGGGPMLLRAEFGGSDTSRSGEIQCRGDNSALTEGAEEFILDEGVLSREICMTTDGLYRVTITNTGQRPLTIYKVYAKLPKRPILPAEALQSLDLLSNACGQEGELLSAECGLAYQELLVAIAENNRQYQVDCREELCLPEGILWKKGERFEGVNNNGATEDGAVSLSGTNWFVVDFAGEEVPRSGLISLILSVNRQDQDYGRVIQAILAPTNTVPDPVQCGDFSSGKQQVLDRLIPWKVRYVELGPVCVDSRLNYELQIMYMGVQKPNSDRIYTSTSGFNLIVEQVDAVLPLEPGEAFPDNAKAALVWEEYVANQCPRLSSVLTGYRDAEQQCKDLLAEMRDLVVEVARAECQLQVCPDNSAGWSPTSSQGEFSANVMSGGVDGDAVILIPSGGRVIIKTGEREPVPADNFPRTGTSDIVLSHKPSDKSWIVRVDVTHTRSKGDNIPRPYYCGDTTYQPFTTQSLQAILVSCTTETRIPGLCLDAEASYTVTVTVEKSMIGVPCAEDVDTSDTIAIDKVSLTLPTSAAEAFPDSATLQELYSSYLELGCYEVRTLACDELDVQIIVGELDSGAVGCGCDARGSLSSSCESIGGQCPCREGYTGRRCELCRAGYYGLQSTGSCTPCMCNSYGSYSDVCDAVTGQCPCKPGLLTSRDQPDLLDCSQCIDGYVGLENPEIDGCVGCTCGEGAASPHCDQRSGTCTCLQGVAPPLCTSCSPGFYNLSPGFGCSECGCDGRGSTSISCGQAGTCSCKDNVVGSKCDSCAPDTFALSQDNPSGCVSCFCSGVTDQCDQANGWTVRENTIRRKWKVADGVQDQRNKYWIGAVRSAEFVWQRSDLGDFYNSYTLRVRVILTGTEGQEVLLRLYRGDTYVTGTLQPGSEDDEFSLYLHEASFSTDRSSLRHLLANISLVEVTTVYPSSQRHDQKLREFTIEEGVRGGGGEEAAHVEQCRCPDGYTGHNCGSCQAGYAKVHLSETGQFRCAACGELCNGRSDTCDRETAECQECTGNTAGPTCSECMDGFYSVEEGGACEPCPCSQNTASPTCTLASGGNYPICDACQEGYTGPNCMDCAPGFWGRDGRCTECTCSSNIDLSNPYSCDRENGLCKTCLYNTTGDRCERCREGFYGNALQSALPKCRECGCDERGSVSGVCDEVTGFCECLPHVSGSKCDKCIAGYWNLTAGVGCSPCGCDGRGALASACDEETGQCECKEGLEGRRCDECPMGSYQTAPLSSLELQCVECGCDPAGSLSPQCNDEGQCACAEGVTGLQCDRCSRGTTGTFPDCEPCGECYIAWEREVNLLEQEVLGLAAQAQNVHLGAANLTEAELQELFTEMREKLREAAELAAQAPDSTGEERREIAATLAALDTELDEKAALLDDLEQRLEGLERKRVKTSRKLGALEDKLAQFSDETAELAEQAKTLSAANLDEALKLVEEAAEQSARARDRALATADTVADAESKAARAQRILEDEVFGDTSTMDQLQGLEGEIGVLGDRLDTLDRRVCGAEEPGECGECGGSRCEGCGAGTGCGGAVGIIAEINRLGEEARECAVKREDDASEATSQLRELNSQAGEIEEQIEELTELSEETQGELATKADEMVELKSRLTAMIESDRTTAEEIEEITDEIAALSLPLSETQLSKLVEDLIQALADTEFLDTEAAVSEEERERLAGLLERAKAASGAANATLEEVYAANSDLAEFDERHSETEELLRETTEVVNDGWRDVNQVLDNLEEGEAAREALEQDLAALEAELEELLVEVAAAAELSEQSGEQIELASRQVQENTAESKRLSDEYDAVSEQVDELEDRVADQITDTQEGSELSEELETAIAEKIAQVEDIAKTFISQQNELIDLSSELVEAEKQLDAVLARLNTKSAFHARCTNDIPG